MAQILNIYSTKSDLKFFEVVMIIDIIAIFLIAIVLIAHASIVNEGAAAIVAVFNIFFSIFGCCVILEFKRNKEVQTYENHVYAKSRQMWNIIHLLTLTYLIFVSGFWAFSKTNKTDLIPIFVFHLLSFFYIIASIGLFKQMISVTFSSFSAANGSNYIESNNHNEKNTKTDDKVLNFSNLWDSDEMHENNKPKGKKTKGDYYEMPQEVIYMNNTFQKKEVRVGDDQTMNEASYISDEIKEKDRYASFDL